MDKLQLCARKSKREIERKAKRKETKAKERARVEEQRRENVDEDGTCYGDERADGQWVSGRAP